MKMPTDSRRQSAGRSWSGGAALAVALCLSGAAPDAVAQKQLLIQLQRDVALLHEELRAMRESSLAQVAGLEAALRESADRQAQLLEAQGEIEGKLAGLEEALGEPARSTAAQVSSLTDQFAALRATVQEIGDVVDFIHDDARDLKTHLASLQPAVPEGEDGVEVDVSAVQASEAIFEGGLTDYLRGEIQAARAQFLDLLALYPTHAKAAEAQFYLAETYYADADYEESIEQYEQVYERHPLSSLAPDSLYKQGMSYEKLRDREAAMEVYELLLRRFPDSSVAALTRSQLNSLHSSKPSPGL